MKKYCSLFLILFLVYCQLSHAQILISGFFANPAGTDSSYEYVQLIATQNIDFSVSNYSVVVCNNGIATANGWINGSTITYGYNLTSGSVVKGEVFYVGGIRKKIAGYGSTDISSANWIKTINNVTTAGDGFGSINSSASGVFGNGGTSADGIAVFSGLTSALTSTTVPVDALFYGTAVGNAKPPTGGYALPTNDRYSNSQGTFGNGTNTYLFNDATSGSFIRLTGTYDLNYLNWTTARTGSAVALTTTSVLGDIVTGITLDESVIPVKLAVTAINGGNNPVVNTPFGIIVQAQDAGNFPGNVTANTSFDLTVATGSGTLSGTISGTINAGSNSATVSGIKYSVAEAGVSVTATRNAGDTLTAGTSAAFTVLDTATQLVFVNVPATGYTATNITSFTVEARRADNSLDLNYSGAITVAKVSGTGAISGTLSKTATSGVAAFNDIQFGSADTYVINATSGTLTQATGSDIVISDPPVTHLVFVNVPSTGLTSVNLSTFTVEARRINNSVDTNYIADITVAKASGTGTLSGTAVKAAVKGVATFDDIQFDAAGIYTIATTSGSLTSDTSGNIVITDPVPARLIVTSVNGGVNPYVNAAFDVVVESMDNAGHAANVTSDKSVNLTILNGVTGTLSGTLISVITSGTHTVTFSNLSYDFPENGLKIRAATTGLTADTSDVFNVISIAASLPTTYAWDTATAYPVGWYASGMSYYTTGNIAPNSGKFDNQGDYFFVNYDSDADSVIYYLKGNSLSGSYQFDLQESADGITYTSLKSHTSSLNSISNSSVIRFSVPASVASRFVKFVYTTKVGGNIAIDDVTIAKKTTPVKLAVLSVNGGTNPVVDSPFDVVIRSVDADNNLSSVSQNTDIQLSVVAGAGALGGTVTGTLLANTHTLTISGVAYNTAETGVKIEASRISGDVLEADTSAPFNVLGIATKLALVNVPVAGMPDIILPQFQVEARRADNTVDNNFTGDITIAKVSGAGTLLGTLVKSSVSGIAIFNDIQFDAADTFKIEATALSLLPDTSHDIIISSTVLVATKLAVTSINGGANVYKNTPFSITVESHDINNSPINVTNNTDIALSLITGSGILGGTLTASIPAGSNTVTISNLTYDVAESINVAVHRTAGDTLTADTSSLFLVKDIANHLLFGTVPTTGTANIAIASFNVEARLASGLLDASFHGDVTVSIFSGPGTISGTLTKTAVNGVAAFNDIAFNTAGTYKLFAESGVLDPDTSADIVITSPPMMTEVYIPQYMQGMNGTNNNRTPFTFYVTLSNLLPNATYRYIDRVDTSATSESTSLVAGVMIGVAQSGNFVRYNNPSLSTAGSYATFVTDANGSYSGWYMVEPSANGRFTPGNNLYIKLFINDGNDGSTVDHVFTSASTMKVINYSTGTTNAGTGLWSISQGMPKNFALVFDNEAGNGRPLSCAVIEPDGAPLQTTYPGFYSTNESTNGFWGVIIPNILPGGIRRIEQRSIIDASLVGCAVDADGIWTTGAINTVNPSSGIAALQIAGTDAPLTNCIILNPVKLVVTSVNGGANVYHGLPFNVTVTAVDSLGNSSNVLSNTNVTLTRYAGTGNLSGTLAGTISAGTYQVVISGIMYDIAENNVSIIAADDAAFLIADTSVLFNVLMPPVKLAITSVNSGADVYVNNAFSVVVESLDANNNAAAATSAISVQLSVATGTGALSGTVTGTIAAGTSSVIISNIIYNVAETGVVLRASDVDDLLASGLSAPFNVLSVAVKLAIVSINGGVDPVLLAPFDVVVESQDINNNPVPVTANKVVTLSLVSGTGVLGGLLYDTIPAGLSSVTISNITYNAAEQGVRIRAATTGLLADTSNLFNVVVEAASIPTSYAWDSASVYPAGWYNFGLNLYTNSGYYNLAPNAGKFDTQDDYFFVYYSSPANLVDYYLKGNSLVAPYQFDVMESTDGSAYTTLMTHTSTVNPLTNTFQHFSAVPNAASRYIKFVYTQKTSGNVGIDDVLIDFVSSSDWKGASSELKMYPNPVKNELNLDNTMNISKISVSNVLGLQVKSVENNFKNKIRIITSEFVPGVYLISVTDNTGNIQTRRFIKQ
ncbi:MAG: T9SS type A sorting domain-containing protein [Bacteroidia bacterium]|nr:T9SS type A sorting domain-containing protein [Bacteroidia bacterium]